MSIEGGFTVNGVTISKLHQSGNTVIYVVKDPITLNADLVREAANRLLGKEEE